MNNEILRSSWALDGTRIFLEFDSEKQKYMVVTRWVVLASFDNVHDAIEAFEVVEMSDDATKGFAQAAKLEMKRTPRHQFLGSGHARIIFILGGAAKRMNGLRPVSCGSKGSITKWQAAK